MAEFGLVPPPTVKTKSSVKATRALSDGESIQATAALLLSLAKRVGNRNSALRGYAGYEWALKNPHARPNATKRLAIIAGWTACEASLANVDPFRRPDRKQEDAILSALYKATPFNTALREKFRKVLFSDDDYTFLK